MRKVRTGPRPRKFARDFARWIKRSIRRAIKDRPSASRDSKAYKEHRTKQFALLFAVYGLSFKFHYVKGCDTDETCFHVAKLNPKAKDRLNRDIIFWDRKIAHAQAKGRHRTYYIRWSTGIQRANFDEWMEAFA